MTDDDQQHAKKQQASRHVTAAGLEDDGRIHLYAGSAAALQATRIG